MSNGSWPLQQGLYTILTGALACGVYDEVPQNAPYPYVTIGESIIVDDGTKTASGTEHASTFHVWSQSAGKKEAKLILAKIYDTLHEKSFVIEGQNLVSCRFDTEFSITLDPDGKTRHGSARYRINLEPTP